ncbi:MAG: FtsW/RodA/SpoVE family cell cycle protein [Lachnospiraceae bacterium]|nr:FtsW/RodA/SpoVE family cell cycle protein [Lachnospiraceae bacterium]
MATNSRTLQPVHKKRRTKQSGSPIRKFLKWSTSFLTSDYYDFNLLAAVILLTCFGLVMLYSTSAYEALIQQRGDDMAYFRKQTVISIVALVVAVIGSNADYHMLAKYSGLIYWFSMFLLFITKFIGREVNGAKRWIYIGPISFQPAEFAKVAVILFLPFLLIKIGKNIRTLKATLTVAAFGLLAVGLTYIFTDNLSTALIILGITVSLIFLVSPNTKQMLLAAGAILILAVIFVFVLVNFGGSSSFRIGRIRVWLNPELYSSDGGYQVMQALYAIGSGGFFGKGLGNSAQKLGAIPEAQNDMIFSIICEELGIFGAALVMLLFIFLLYRLFFIAQNAPDLLGSLIVSGIFVHIALQVVLNIAVVVNLIPTTGITLPFVSYGGTSIVFLMTEMLLALSVSKQIRFQ